MKYLTIAVLLCLALACRTSKAPSMKSGKLNGTWVPAKEEMAGTALPPAAFAAQRLTIEDSTYTFVAESVDKGVVKYDADKMDIYGKEGVNMGRHFTAIYKYENDELTICYNLKGDTYPASFDTKGNPMYFMCVFKRQAVTR